MRATQIYVRWVLTDAGAKDIARKQQWAEMPDQITALAVEIANRMTCVNGSAVPTKFGSHQQSRAVCLCSASAPACSGDASLRPPLASPLDGLSFLRTCLGLSLFDRSSTFGVSVFLSDVVTCMHVN
jgi:hypothetical protein